MRAGHASLGGVHYLGIGRAEGGAQKPRIFHAGVAVELWKPLPESVPVGDGQGGHLPVHVALVEQLRLAQRRAGKRRRVHAPKAVQNVGLGPDDAGGIGAHVVNLEAFGLAHGVLEDSGALGGDQIRGLAVSVGSRQAATASSLHQTSVPKGSFAEPASVTASS